MATAVLDTYAGLQGAVLTWANRGDAVVGDQVVNFVRLGEERIYRTLRLSGMVTVGTLTIPAAANYVALPAGWLEFKRISSAAEHRIEYMPPDALYDLPAPGDASRYSIEGDRLIYGQTPAANLTLDVRYYARPDYLAITPTNWLLTQAPSLFLYAALVELAVFTRNAAMLDQFGGMFDKVKGEMQSVDGAATVSGGRLRLRRA